MRSPRSAAKGIADAVLEISCRLLIKGHQLARDVLPYQRLPKNIFALRWLGAGLQGLQEVLELGLPLRQLLGLEAFLHGDFDTMPA